MGQRLGEPLPGRERQDVHQRNEAAPGQCEQHERRSLHVTGATQAEARCHVERVEDLVAGGEPEQVAAEHRHAGPIRFRRAHELCHQPRTTDGEQQSHDAHVDHGDLDRGIAHAPRPWLVTGTDCLAHQCRARDGDAQPG